MARLTMDQPEFAEKPGGPRCILDGLGSEPRGVSRQPALPWPPISPVMRIWVTEVAYYPLWLERSQSQAPMQPQM